MPRLEFESNSEPFTVTPLNAGSGAPTYWPEREGGSCALAQANGKSAVEPATRNERRSTDGRMGTDS